MNRRKKWMVGAVLALTLIGAGVGIGLAGTNREAGEAAEGADSDQPPASADRERAEAAALEAVGGGTVTEVEIGDDGAAYGVEIRLDDGSQVEVNLDESFAVIGTEADDD